MHNLAVACPIGEPAAPYFLCYKHVVRVVDCHDGCAPGCDVGSGAIGANVADGLELEVLAMVTLPAGMADT